MDALRRPADSRRRLSGMLLAGMAAGVGVGWGVAAIGRPRAATPEIRKPAGPSAEDSRVALGRELFHREWTPDDPRSHGGDGLGPVYNDTSCVACHNLGGAGGAGPANKNIDIVAGLKAPKSPRPGTVRHSHQRAKPDPEAETALARLEAFAGKAGSAVVHRFGTHPDYAPWRAELFTMDPTELGDPAAPRNDLKDLARPREDRDVPRRRGVLMASRPEVVRSQRNPTSLRGAGLIDAIPEEAIVAAASRQYRGFPEITGRAIRPDGEGVGRFGWKAQTASLAAFVRGACSAELGLDVPGHSQSADPLEPEGKAPGHDLDAAECDALADYVRALPPPAAAPGDAEVIHAGREAFAAVGCATCHMPDLGPARGIYSDLSLHDLGRGLVDSGRSYGGRPIAPTSDQTTGGQVASATEWKTPPLWGLRDSAPYLHDGRAETVERAIVLHGGEAQAVVDRYLGLPPSRRRALVTFLNTLGAPADPTPAGLARIGD